MPRATRDQKFRKAFDIFMEEYGRELCDEFGELQGWTLENLTKNRNSYQHTYGLKIPQEIIIGMIDRHTIDGDIKEADYIYQMQRVPDSADFDRSLNRHFEKYALVVRDTNMSYVEVESSEDQEDFLAIINVVYHKQHLPYRVYLSEKEELQAKVLSLEEHVSNLKRNIKTSAEMYEEKYMQNTQLLRKLRRFTYKLHEANKKDAIILAMQKKMREIYAASDKKEDCPVCWEPICAEALIVPGCCHSICSSCVERCTICPLCRDEYLVK
jgi:hypothetical protein